MLLKILEDIMYRNNNRSRVRRPIRKNKVKKTKYILFSTTIIVFLTLVFIKFFLPALNSNLKSNPNVDDGSGDVVWVENKENTIKAKTKKADESLEDAETKVEPEKTDEIESNNEEQTGDSENNPNENKTKKAGEYDFKMDSAVGSLIYYNQTDKRWADLLYGPQDPIGTHGCGPTVMATIVSSLTDTQMNPKEMSDWAHENGYCAVGNGSSHSLIPETAKAFGLNVEPLYRANAEDIRTALNNGKIVVALSGHGIFSPDDGHFFIIREIKPNGKVTISDSVKLEHVFMQWDIDTILSQASPVSSAGGPFWAISK